MQIVRPTAEHLPSYVAALEHGWSADNVRGAVAAAEELLRIQADAAAFVNSMEDREAKGPPVTLPDGSVVNRIPGFRRWLWDGEFCGSIGLRWQPGTTELPPHCLGHIGYAVVPWKQGQGYAKSALGQLLPEAKAVGLPFVEITTDLDNTASQRVILANAGYLVAQFNKPAQFGGKTGLRFRIDFKSDCQTLSAAC
jgi:predicted acetyltransferase